MEFSWSVPVNTDLFFDFMLRYRASEDVLNGSCEFEFFVFRDSLDEVLPLERVIRVVRNYLLAKVFYRI